MTNLLAWKTSPFSGHTGSAGGTELFTLHWHTRDSEPKYFMRCQLPGLQSRSWKDDDPDALKALAGEQLAAWLTRIGARIPAETEAAGDANVFADPHSHAARALGRDVRIRFGTTEDGAFDVEMKDGGLEVSLYDLQGRGVAILPRSDNSVTIRKVQRWTD